MFLQSHAPKHWVARRKAAVVLAVRSNLISLSEACVRYELSVDEFESWDAAFDNQGIAGLLAKRRIPKSKEPAVKATEVPHRVELPNVISEPRWHRHP